MLPNSQQSWADFPKLWTILQPFQQKWWESSEIRASFDLPRTLFHLPCLTSTFFDDNPAEWKTEIQPNNYPTASWAAKGSMRNFPLSVLNRRMGTPKIKCSVSNRWSIRSLAFQELRESLPTLQRSAHRLQREKSSPGKLPRFTHY